MFKARDMPHPCCKTAGFGSEHRDMVPKEFAGSGLRHSVGTLTIPIAVVVSERDIGRFQNLLHYNRSY
jgi:hypothetical protein